MYLYNFQLSLLSELFACMADCDFFDCEADVAIVVTNMAWDATLTCRIHAQSMRRRTMIKRIVHQVLGYLLQLDLWLLRFLDSWSNRT